MVPGSSVNNVGWSLDMLKSVDNILRYRTKHPTSMLHKKTHILTALALALAIPALAQEENCGVTATVQLVEPDCGENANGSVLITAAGGVEPYTYYLLGNVVGA